MARLSSRVLLAALALGGCSDLLPEAERVPTTLRLDQDTVTVVEGNPVHVGVTVLDQNGEPFDRVPAWAAPAWSFSQPGRVEARDGFLVALQPGATTGTVTVAGLTATAALRVNPRELGLSVAGVYLTQSVQSMGAPIPLVKGRDALLRVFLRGDRLNFFRPQVRVQLLSNGAPVQTLTLQAEGDSVPTAINEGVLASSWNVMVPGAVVQPGLSLVVEADPGRTLPLRAGSQLRYPASGSLAPEVVTVPKFWLRLVPVTQTLHGTTGQVSNLNREQWVQELLGMFPIAEHDVDVRAPYATSRSASTQEGWSRIVEEMYFLRTADGSRRYYYGVLTSPGGTTIAGIGFIGLPAALGYDRLPAAAGTLAHELGHNFGRRHAPCGNPAGPDPNFPHAGGGIGVFGYDVFLRSPKDPGREKDLMTYCTPEWISDYTYRAVLAYRTTGGDGGTGGDAVSVSEVEEPSLLVWGRVGGSGAALEPAFELTTRPSLPEPGPYRIEGLDAAGAVLFSLPFRGAQLAEGDTTERHFAYAIPARLARTDRLASLRVTGRGVRAERRPSALAAPRRAPAAALRRGARRGEVRLEWAAGGQPAALVRDARTGEVVAIARDGGASLRTGASELEVLFSDGVRTTRRVLRPE
ncbi:MAG TPA: hypothetical protein VF263_14110 [Longimicrobiaceae bacterium]